MKNKAAAAAMVSMFLLPGLLGILAQAQEAREQPGVLLFMKAGTFDPMKDPPPFPDDLTGADSGGHYIVQFTGPVEERWKEVISSRGAVFHGYLPDHAYIVKLGPEEARSIPGLSFVRWMGAYHPGYKLSPYLEGMSGRISMSVLFFDDGQALEFKLRALGIDVLWTDWLAVRIRADASMARVLAFMPQVQFVEPFNIPTLLNDNDARILHVRQQNDGNFTNNGFSIWSYNSTKFEGLATGKGVNVAVQDSGVDGTHVDFTNKKIFYKSYFGSSQWTDSLGHGTHVAGTVLGTGQGQAGKYAGLAPEAGLIALQGITSGTIAPESASAASLKDVFDNGGDICTNSWGDGSLHGTYGSYAIAYDTRVRDADPSKLGNQSVIVIFAAGNEAFSGVREPATAKNVITVGATGNNAGTPILPPDQIAQFSSNGPTADGRRKPDVMAPGAEVTSCNWGTVNGYIAHDGTSMAAPGVAGAVAVIVQYYRDNNGAAPSPAMVKALLANGADIMSSSYDYPGNGQGWGRVNVQKSLLNNKTYQILSEDQKVSLRTGEQQLYNATVSSTSAPFKVMLAWTDPPGTPSANKELVNDLDLVLISPSGATYYGNHFANGQSSYGGNPDTLNNLEGFYLKVPEAGTWTIKVTGSNVPQGPQDYAIAFSGDIDVSLDFVDLKVVSGPTYSPSEPAEGEVVTFNATLRNNGTLPAAAVLYRITVGDKLISNITLPELIQNDSIDVSAKWTAVRGKYTVRVEVDPLNIIREKNETNNLRSTPLEVLYHGLVVVSSASDMDVNPGWPAVFNLDVKNSGNANDTYTIKKLGGTPPPGWKENLTAESVNVRKLSSERVNFTIWPPGNATVGERCAAQVMVTSDGNSSYTQTVDMSVKVKQVFGMNFTTDSPGEVRADPGETVACNFTLVNPGNGKDYFKVSATVVGRPTPWKFGIGQANYTLGPRGSANMSLNIEVPKEAFANDTTTINITASSASSGSRSYRIRTTVRQRFITEMTVDGATDRMMPGGNLSYRLGITNGGNGNDTLIFKATGPEGWSVTLGRTAILLLPRGEGTLDLSITCPAESLAGVYEVNVTCTGSGGNILSRIINVTVAQFFKIRLGIEPANRTITQGESTEFMLTVGNIGNGNDTFAFTTLNLPDGISARYSPETISLGPGEENTVTVTVTTANTTAAANHTFILKAISEGRQVISNTTHVSLEVLAIPTPQPPLPPPPPTPNPIASGEIPLLLILLLIIVIGAAAGGAGYAVHRRNQRMKDAWKPSQLAPIPTMRPPPEAFPAYSGTGVTLYPPPSPDTSDTEPHSLASIKAHCERHEARADAYHADVDKFTSESKPPQGESIAIVDHPSETDPDLPWVSGLRQKAEEADAQTASKDVGQSYADQLDDAEDSGPQTGTKPAEWLANKGQPLANKLPGPFDDWAKKGEEFGDQAQTDRSGEPSGPRFERPDWSPDDNSGVPSQPPVEPPLPPPPPLEYQVPPPPPVKPPPPPGPAAPSATELDELMKRIKDLSRK